MLSKPWTTERLNVCLTRIHRVRKLLRDPRFRRAVGDVDSLPSVPDILLELNDVLNRETASTSDVADGFQDQRQDPSEREFAAPDAVYLAWRLLEELRQGNEEESDEEELEWQRGLGIAADVPRWREAATQLLGLGDESSEDEDA